MSRHLPLFYSPHRHDLQMSCMSKRLFFTYSLPFHVDFFPGRFLQFSAFCAVSPTFAFECFVPFSSYSIHRVLIIENYSFLLLGYSILNTSPLLWWECCASMLEGSRWSRLNTIPRTNFGGGECWQCLNFADSSLILAAVVTSAMAENNKKANAPALPAVEDKKGQNAKESDGNQRGPGSEVENSESKLESTSNSEASIALQHEGANVLVALQGILSSESSQEKTIPAEQPREVETPPQAQTNLPQNATPSQLPEKSLDSKELSNAPEMLVQVTLKEGDKGFGFPQTAPLATPTLNQQFPMPFVGYMQNQHQENPSSLAFASTTLPSSSMLPMFPMHQQVGSSLNSGIAMQPYNDSYPLMQRQQQTQLNLLQPFNLQTESGSSTTYPIMLPKVDPK